MSFVFSRSSIEMAAIGICTGVINAYIFSEARNEDARMYLPGIVFGLCSAFYFSKYVPRRARVIKALFWTAICLISFKFAVTGGILIAGRNISLAVMIAGLIGGTILLLGFKPLFVPSISVKVKTAAMFLGLSTTIPIVGVFLHAGNLEPGFSLWVSIFVLWQTAVLLMLGRNFG